MSFSHKIALAIVIIVTLWVASGFLFPKSEPEPALEATENNINERIASIVITPEVKEQWISLYGETEPNRRVRLKAETSGPIISIPKKEGDFIKQGETLVKIDLEDRVERLRQSETLVAQRRIEYKAAKKLKRDGFSTAIAHAESKARLAEAEANLKRAKIDLKRTDVKAPFSGRVERINAELGDFVGVNVFGAEGSIAEVVDMNPIIVRADLPQQYIDIIEKDTKASVQLNGGKNSYQGTVRYIAKVADQQTRTFAIEIAIDNPEYEIAAGIVAEVKVLLREVAAYKVTGSAMVLNDDGEIGIKIIDNDSKVRFVAASVIEETRDGLWLAGPIGDVEIITLGQAYLKEGQVIKRTDNKAAQEENPEISKISETSDEVTEIIEQEGGNDQPD